MQDFLAESLKMLKRNRVRRRRMLAIVLVLSLVVSLDVFWILRQPGWTLAGDADCKITEHTHDEACQSGEEPCDKIEHVHSVSCYSDETADEESQLDWQKMFSNYPYTEDLRQDLVGIAKAQVGYQESTENFQVDSEGIRHGYTRYGDWYGAPYNDWSAIFVSFCLHYAGADPEEYPGNIGANAMAESWKKLERYAPIGTYDPVPGDLVFFTDNTVGIIGEKLSATAYIIRGDINNAVCGDTLRVTDPSIAGWGIVGDLPEIQQNRPDLSKGPVFTISINDENPSPKLKASPWSLRTTADDQDATSILEYLQGRGSYYVTLIDANNHELPKDANGNYYAEANTQYRLVISFNSPEGFKKGTYLYEFPAGAVVSGGSGDFELRDKTNVGSWTVSDTGLITMTFNEKINNRTEITISADMYVIFPETEEPIDFDGKITVTVNKQQEETITTKLTKWGSQGIIKTDKDDPSKIYWTIRIDGNRDSNIPGSVLTDRVLIKNPNLTHRYTASDMAAGITFGASVKDETGNDTAWHKWTVTADQITWDENGWTYTMPETQTCQICGNEFTLGNEGWTYYVEYTSTPDCTNIAGNMSYTNEVELDNQTAEGVAQFAQGDVKVAVFKKGTLISNASGSKFLWEVQATIPGRKDPATVDTTWILNDELAVSNMDEYGAYNWVAWVNNDFLKGTITANYYGTTINVPNIADATANDPYAWKLSWTQSENGVGYGQNIQLLCQCKCTEESLVPGIWHWHDGYGQDGTAYCNYWTEIEDTTFTVTYTTDDFAAIENYAYNGNVLRNVARLAANYESSYRAETGANIRIPSVIQKDQPIGYEEQFPHYTITVNEAKLTLTDGSPLLIRDVMTDTLAYIKGSMIIKAEDADGNTWELYRDQDFIVTYDSHGPPDENGHPTHVIEIKILRPQPVTYTLDYDTEIICEDMDDVVDGKIKYSNKATVTLWGDDFADSTTEKTFASLNIAARAYQIDLFKFSADQPNGLAGATFGLFNEQGVLITQDITDASGRIDFHSDVENGIILREHQLYYVQELRAPLGYQLDETKHWICFCNEEGDTCSTYKEVLAGVNAIRIPLGQDGSLQVENVPMNYILPGTGGPGVYPVILVSVTFILTPLVYISILMRKRERRGVG